MNHPASHQRQSPAHIARRRQARDERRAKALRMHEEGHDYFAIAMKLGATVPTIRRDIREAKKAREGRPGNSSTKTPSRT